MMLPFDKIFLSSNIFIVLIVAALPGIYFILYFLFRYIYCEYLQKRYNINLKSSKIIKLFNIKYARIFLLAIILCDILSIMYNNIKFEIFSFYSYIFYLISFVFLELENIMLKKNIYKNYFEGQQHSRFISISTILIYPGFFFLFSGELLKGNLFYCYDRK